MMRPRLAALGVMAPPTGMVLFPPFTWALVIPFTLVLSLYHEHFNDSVNFHFAHLGTHFAFQLALRHDTLIACICASEADVQ